MRWLRGIVGLACFMSVAGVAAQEATSFDTSALPGLYTEIEARKTPGLLRQQCPADIWRTEARAFYQFAAGEIEYDACASDVMACARLCFDGKSPDACFETARVIEDNTRDDDVAAKGQVTSMFAQACATGSASGCTNRGSYLMSEPAITRDCVHRTFQLSCGQDDPWGCTMLGVTFQQGEGVAVDAAQAKTAYDRSCALAPDFDACAAARALAEQLK